jgi:tRNA(His) 5'-end guanylyltransferase
MKQYEAVSQTYLMRRTPVIIRLDGVAFHTFTKNFDKPLDEPFSEAMRWVTRHLVNNIQGCLMGYTQSDEISLVLQDYKKLDTDAWFGYNVQKLVSVSAQ